jgi:two-component system chemotaxis response regulator CheB
VERRFDVFLTSLADSYGERGLAVVLSGAGRDGAAGALAMQAAGAIVIAESPDTAEYRDMPMAAAQAGAEVLPVWEIGRVLTDIVDGAPLSASLRRPDDTDCAALQRNPSRRRPVQETDRETIAAGGRRMQKGATTNGRARAARVPLSSTDNDAAARAEAARQRAAELRRRRQDLAAGRGATAQTVAIARRRAEESLRRARQAGYAAEVAGRRPAG